MKWNCKTVILFLWVSIFAIESNAQFSVTYQTREGVETGYLNVLVEGDNGYFVLKRTSQSIAGDGSQDLLVTKFDLCHEELWTKAYHNGSNFSLRDAVYDNGRIVILMDSEIFAIDDDGEILLSKAIRGEQKITLQKVVSSGNSLDLIGATDLLRQNLTIKISYEGELLEAVQVKVLNQEAIEGKGPVIGGSYTDGSIIQRRGNALIKLDENYTLEWVKQFDLDFFGITEAKPLIYEDDVVYCLRKNDLIFLLRLDSSGEVIWQSEGFEALYVSHSIYSSNGMIYVNTTPDESTNFGLVKINGETGEIISFNTVVQPHLRSLSFPQFLVLRESDEMVVTASHLVNFSVQEWEDLLFIEPLESPCNSIEASETYPLAEVSWVDVSQHMESRTPEIQIKDINIRETTLDKTYNEICVSHEDKVIDTTYHCDEPFIFEGESDAAYTWSDGSISQRRVFSEATSISVEIMGCKIRETIAMTINEQECPCKIYAPNVFNPLSVHNENQSFGIHSNCNFDVYKLNIYDRWGNHVFHSDNTEIRWTGTTQGTDLAAGVYAYVLMYALPGKDKIETKFGSLTLIR
ncbi:MAG: gliding motility-associated C-terminal domain-containing protein [Bacteroidota bacterium]